MQGQDTVHHGYIYSAIIEITYKALKNAKIFDILA